MFYLPDLMELTVWGWEGTGTNVNKCKCSDSFKDSEGKVQQTMQENKRLGDFPGGAVVKNPPANAGDTGSIPGLGRYHMPRSN